MQTLLKEYDGKLRWAHRARVDPRHPQDSARIHIFAHDAFQHGGKFWEVRERLLAVPSDVTVGEAELTRIARELEMDYAAISKRIENPLAGQPIALDFVFSEKFGVTGELGLFVNGRRLNDEDKTQDLASALRPLIKEELAEAERLIAGGVAKERVYDELIKNARWGVGEEALAAQQAASNKGKQ
jgi:hypothetical protein